MRSGCRFCINPKTKKPIVHRISKACPKKNMNVIYNDMKKAKSKLTKKELLYEAMNYEYSFEMILDERIPRDQWFDLIKMNGTENIDDPYFEIRENDPRLDDEILNYLDERCFNFYYVSE